MMSTSTVTMNMAQTTRKTRMAWRRVRLSAPVHIMGHGWAGCNRHRSNFLGDFLPIFSRYFLAIFRDDYLRPLTRATRVHIHIHICRQQSLVHNSSRPWFQVWNASRLDPASKRHADVPAQVVRLALAPQAHRQCRQSVTDTVMKQARYSLIAISDAMPHYSIHNTYTSLLYAAFV
jgi:hypothetical protein